MSADNDRFWSTQLISAILSGVAAYLRYSASPTERWRRMRWFMLVYPVVLHFALRPATRETVDDQGRVSRQISCLPWFLAMLGALGYMAYIFGTGRRRRDS